MVGFPLFFCRVRLLFVNVAPVESWDAPGGQMAIPTMPCSGMEDLKLTGYGHGGLLFLLLDQ